MFSMPYLCICIYCMLQLSFILVMSKRNRRVYLIQERYFSLLLIIMQLSFVADIISSLYNGPDWIFPLVATGNYFEVLLNTIMLLVYFLYICTHISNIDFIVKRRINIILWILAIISYSTVISTVITKQVFYFDEAKIYHRGPLFWFPMVLLFAMMLIIEGFVIKQKSKIEAKHYRSLLLFLIFPIIGWALQLLIFGLPFSLISAAFAAQVIFANIQNRSMDTDYLTGLFNRQSLDHHMQNKIDTATIGNSFSAILIDIDEFKSINDYFGHYEGDLALINTANLLRKSVGHKDFIARYGGDEFCIIIDEDDPAALATAVQNINSNLQELNDNSKKQYRLSFSIGYDVYRRSMGNQTEQFIRIIDQKMYDKKKSRKDANKTSEIKTNE